MRFNIKKFCIVHISQNTEQLLPCYVAANW